MCVFKVPGDLLPWLGISVAAPSRAPPASHCSCACPLCSIQAIGISIWATRCGTAWVVCLSSWAGPEHVPCAKLLQCGARPAPRRDVPQAGPARSRWQGWCRALSLGAGPCPAANTAPCLHNPVQPVVRQSRPRPDPSWLRDHSRWPGSPGAAEALHVFVVPGTCHDGSAPPGRAVGAGSWPRCLCVARVELGCLPAWVIWRGSLGRPSACWICDQDGTRACPAQPPGNAAASGIPLSPSFSCPPLPPSAAHVLCRFHRSGRLDSPPPQVSVCGRKVGVGVQLCAASTDGRQLVLRVCLLLDP